MTDIRKLTSEQLRAKINKFVHLQNGDGKYYEIAENNFAWYIRQVEIELDRRNRAAIYRAACRVLKNRYSANQFTSAAHYADAVVNGDGYFSTDNQHEIGGYYTKSGNPYIVYFD